ncbi:MAG: Lrp/AsnC ligand binding domain-containing protein [archaeon]
MPVAFVLMNVESGSEETVLDQVRKLPGVREAYFVYGVYDIVSKIEDVNMDGLKEIAANLRRVDKVRSTLTMIATS